MTATNTLFVHKVLHELGFIFMYSDRYPPKKFPAIKFPKMTTWDKKFLAKKFSAIKF